MNALVALIVVVNLVLLALVGADRLDKTIFYRFLLLTLTGGLLASKLGLFSDHRTFVTMVIGLGILDLVLIAIYQIVLALRRRGRQPRAKGNILTRLRETYAPTVRRALPDWERPELADVTRELEKQGFRACGDFEEVTPEKTHGPMRAFFDEARTTAAVAHLREDSRKKIQPVAIHFLTQLSEDRWVLTDPTPSKHSFASLDRPPNVDRLSTSSGWSPSTAAKAHARHVAEVIAAQGGTALVIENSFEAWCNRRDAYWNEVCAHRKRIGWMTEAESMHMFGNDLAYHEVVRLLGDLKTTEKLG